jgi:hypothetical protein
MENLCSWTPELVVELIKVLAWPVTIIIIGIRFRMAISDSLQKFSSKNRVSEVSASSSGVTAKFVAAQQSSEALIGASTNAVNLPETMSLEGIRQRLIEYKTEFSEELLVGVEAHVAALGVGPEETIDLLAQEVSLLQSAIRYFDINDVLFRSQFDLLLEMSNNGGRIGKSDLEHYLLSAKKRTDGQLLEWDQIKYVAYPVSNKLMRESDTVYSLTSLGRSYLKFMSKNPQLVDKLTKL